jgi:hypothetical protein
VKSRQTALLAALLLAFPLTAASADEPRKFDWAKSKKVVVQEADVDPAAGATAPGTPVVEVVPTSAEEPASTEGEMIEQAVPEGAVAPAEEAVVPQEVEGLPSDVIQPEQVMGEGYKTCFIEDFNVDYPLWYVRADGNWLNRTTSTELTTATVRADDGTIGNNRIISQEFDAAPGMRSFFGRNIWDGMTYIEMGYFGLNHWDELTELRNLNGVGIIASNLDMGFGTNTNPDFQRIAYSSTIHNAELNIRSFFSPNFVFVGGLRYFNLNETLVINERGLVDLVLSNPNAASTVAYNAWRNISTDNNLLGPQIGLDWAYEFTDDIRVNLLSRVGLCANFSQSTVRQQREGIEQLQGNVGQIVRDARVVNDEEVVIAGLLELHSSIDILLTKNILFRGGWQFMWVSGIAVAPEQHADSITNPNGLQRQIENGADAIFFGPFAGLEFYWGGVDY